MQNKSTVLLFSVPNPEGGSFPRLIDRLAFWRGSNTRCRTLRAAAAILALALSAPAKSALAEEVYLVRGLLDAYSQGIDTIADKLKAKRVNAKAMSNGRWVVEANSIIKRNKTGEVSFPIIIVGFSIGGVEAVEFANTLGRANIPVELVLGIDPGAPVPSRINKNVRKAKTYRIITGHKYRGGLGHAGKIENVDATALKVNHTTITMHPDIQRQIMADIARALRSR